MSTSAQAPVRRFVPPARFRVPAPPSAYVPRPALVDRLERSAAPLTIVVGSPGAGKTALVGSWVEQHAHPTVWLSCDPTDDDPVRFWSALAVAVQHVVADAGADALRRLDADGHEGLDAAASLASDLGAGGDLVVVVDDFHLVGSAPAVVAAFVRALPVGVRLVLLTRQDPSFPVGRLRAQGRLLEIRDRDMALDLEEAGRLLGLLGVEVDEEDLQRLLELTEGWAAGLHLAGLSLLARPDPEGLLKEFADTDRGVSDFLVNEVLDLQEPDVADFLARTSVLESFDAGLCAAVTGRDDAGEVLRRLLEAHLFVVQLDRRAGWYRYHHLFGSFLRGRLAERTPHGLQDAHAAAARAYAERGDVLSAVDHAMAASDVDGAFRLLRGAVMDQLDVESRRAAVDTIRAWLRQYGAAHLESDPELVLECCLYLAALAAQGDLEVWLDRWEQRAATHTPDPGNAALHAAVWALHLLHAGDPDAALARMDEARRLDREHPSPNFWVSQWPVVAVQAHLWRDDLQAAADAVVEARRTPSPAPVHDVVRLPGLQAWTAAVGGELLEAEREAGFALESADALGLAPSNLGRVFPLLALAVVAADRGDADGANRLADAATSCAEIAARPPMLLLSLLCQAGNAIAQGRTADASALLGRAELVLPAATPVVHDHVRRMEARAAVGAGQASAGALVRGLRPTAVRELLAARHLVATGDRVAAARLLDDVRTRMTTRRLRVEHGLLRARACAPGDRTRAVHEVTTAAELAAPVGLLRPFVEEAAHLRGALEVVTADPRLEPFVGRALDVAGRRPAVARAASGRPAVDGLSDRELDVLRYLASRLTYPEVARELFISVNTLKSHVKAVYRKLGAAGREEAVAAARRTGLL